MTEAGSEFQKTAQSIREVGASERLDEQWRNLRGYERIVQGV